MNSSRFALLAGLVLIVSTVVAATHGAEYTFVLPDDRLADMREALVNELDNRAREREQYYLTIVGIIGAIIVGGLGLIGYRSFADISRDAADDAKTEIMNFIVERHGLNSIIDESITIRMNRLTEEFSRSISSMNNEVAFVRLIAVAKKLKDGDSVPRNERDAAMNHLLLLSNDKNIRSNPEFIVALRDIVDSFSAASQYKFLDKLDNLFSDDLVEDIGSSMILIQTYARRSIGEVPEDDYASGSCRKYVKACKELGYAEVAIPYEIGLEHKKSIGKKSEIVDQIFQNVRHLGDVDREHVLQAIRFNSDIKLLTNRTVGSIERVAAIYSDLLLVYGDEIASLEPDKSSDRPAN